MADEQQPNQEQPLKKSWWKSKAILSGIFNLGVIVAGVYLGEASMTVSVMVAVGSCLGIYGRAVAKSQVK